VSNAHERLVGHPSGPPVNNPGTKRKQLQMLGLFSRKTDCSYADDSFPEKNGVDFAVTFLFFFLTADMQAT
jgi:hypothetical protein